MDETASTEVDGLASGATRHEDTESVSQTAVEPSIELPEGVGTPDTENDKGKAAKEAAKYRTRLREAESALEAANARIEGYQRAEAAQAASDLLSDGNDLFLFHSLAEFVTEDGQVDTEAVKEATHALMKTRPGLRKVKRFVDPTQGLGRDHSRASGPSWNDLLSR